MTGTRARRREPFSWWYRFAAMDRLGTGLFASVSFGGLEWWPTALRSLRGWPLDGLVLAVASGWLWQQVAPHGSTIVEFGQTEYRYPLCIPLHYFFGPWPMDVHVLDGAFAPGRWSRFSAVPGHHDVYLSAFSPGSSKAECAIWCPPQPMHLSDKLERTLSRIQMKHDEAWWSHLKPMRIMWYHVVNPMIDW